MVVDLLMTVNSSGLKIVSFNAEIDMMDIWKFGKK